MYNTILITVLVIENVALFLLCRQALIIKARRARLAYQKRERAHRAKMKDYRANLAPLTMRNVIMS